MKSSKHPLSLIPIFPLCLAGMACVFDAPSAYGQADGVPIIEQNQDAFTRNDARINEDIEALEATDALLSLEELNAQIANPIERSFKLAKKSTTPLTPNEVYERAKKSIFRVGWSYLCNSCDNRHLTLAGGYAISVDGGIATCAHVVKPPSMKEGYPIAVDYEGNVFPIKQLNAFDAEMDAAIVTIDHRLTPLALNADIRPGEAAYCLSNPYNQFGYFSQGIVNRFYWRSGGRGDDDTTLAALGSLRLNVSTDWAPGSSGSPVLDSFGNAIGHVAEIMTLPANAAADKSKPATLADIDTGTTMIALHSATPSRSVIALASNPPVPNPVGEPAKTVPEKAPEEESPAEEVSEEEAAEEEATEEEAAETTV